jgi:hypothetical protein
MIRFFAILTLLFSTFGHFVNAQINETFSDLDFTTNPEWTGDTDKFEIINPPNSGDGSIDISWSPDAHLLRSIPDSSSAALTTASNRTNGEWLFSIADGRGWAVSGSNDYYVIIMSDSNDPALLKDDSKNFNGYYLRFDGSNNDNFSFYKQTGTTSTLLINTGFPDGNDGTTSKAYSVKITRDVDGNWELFIDEGLYLEAATSRGTASDNEITSSSYFGIVTNIANPGTARTAYIDNIITRDPYTDTFPPFVSELQINGTNHVHLIFNELIDSLTAHTLSNYSIQSIGNAREISYYFENTTEIQIVFNESFIPNGSYALYINGIEDLNGNAMDTTIQFTVSDILGQNITESFTDFDLTNNLTWTGDISDFEIINPPIEGDGSYSEIYENDGALLRSKANTASRCITTELIRNYGQWSFTIADGSGWSISGTNDFYVILTANINDPALLKADNPNFYGYYLRYDGSTDDSFVLYKQTGTTATPIIETGYPAGSDGSTPIPYSVKITRDTLSGWSLYIDEGSYTDAITLRGTSQDNEIQTGNYFGVVTNINTPSESRVVYLDSIYAGKIIVDEQAPFIESVKIIGEKDIQLTFDEIVDSTSAHQLTNYNLAGFGNPMHVGYYYENKKEIVVSFGDNFTAGSSLSLSMANIADANGNPIDTTINFAIPNILGQNIYESFTDFDLTNNISWTGELNDFEIVAPLTEGDGSFSEAYENDGALLKSKANTESSCITTELIRNYGQWSFTIAEGSGWSISGSNDYYIVITANTNDTTALKPDIPNFYGYFLRRDGGTDDKFVLYKQQGTISTPIIETNYPEGNDGSTSIPYSVKITRDMLEGWSLYIDEGAYNEPFTLRGTSQDNEIQTGNYFGIVTNVSTASETRVLYVDSIYAGEIIKDTIAPMVEKINVLDTNKLEIVFSEPIDTNLLNTTNFVSDINGNPSSLNIQNAGRALQLIFSGNFPLREVENLTISELADPEGNEMADTTVQFAYFEPIEGDIVINEIFFDNTPVVALPEYDYIELYNRSDFDINLENWTIEIGDDTRSFPDYILTAKDYLIVTSSAAVETYALYGNALDIITTTLLTNSGKQIRLKDSTGQNIHQIAYTQSWYRDADKEDGGWSIEQIDPEWYCAQAGNWKASTNSLGGTPGMQNSVLSENPDTVSPYIKSINIINDNELSITFSETFPESFFTVNNISISPTNVITELLVDENNSTKWNIRLTNPLPVRETIEVVVNNLTDFCGNTTLSDTASAFMVPSYFQQIIFTEILAKPADEERIRYEFLELYNHDSLPVNIENWTLKIGSRSLILPSATIEARNYFLIMPEFMSAHPNAPENAIFIFDESDLTDGGTTLQLLDENQNIVTWVDYDDDWHTNSLADLGGYSLERIDNSHYCGSSNNWETSTATIGGTPGEVNSVAAENPDETTPDANFILVPKDTSLIVRFNESLWPVTEKGIINSTLSFDTIFIPHPFGQDLILKLREPLEDNTLYEMTINKFTDCNMNEMADRTFTFKKPIEAGEGDFVINEVLFNPPSGCNDFVEVLNLTDNYLDLSRVYSAKLDDSGIQDDIDEVTEESYILPPNEYYIFTESTECLEEAYGNIDIQKSILTNLPSMSDDEGNIQFINFSGEIIDQMSYNSNMHHSLLDDEDGVSLERISPYGQSDNPSNWHSAASDAGFATPTRVNSQYNDGAITESNISLEKETLSPDGDGYEDYLRINYQFNTGSNVLSIKILDHNGRLVRKLINNETVSTEGFVTWDGTDDSRHKVPVGIYILYSEWFDENGNQNYDKQTCVVAGGLK